MQPTQIRSFVERYLQNTDCQIIESTPDEIDVQLSVQADKELLNRPFYWMYVEQMHLPPNPVRFRFTFTEEASTQDFYSDYLFYGSPRLTRMLQSAQKQGQTIRLYQQPPKNNQRLQAPPHGYHPWLAVNFRISYLCDQKKDRLHYLAIDLQQGELHDDFYSWALSQQWTHQLPPKRYLHPSQIPLAQAVGMLEEHLQAEIEQEDATWAEEAYQRLEAERQQLAVFYPEESIISTEQQAEKKQRLHELTWQYQPRVEIEVINAGLFYLWD